LEQRGTTLLGNFLCFVINDMRWLTSRLATRIASLRENNQFTRRQSGVSMIFCQPRQRGRSDWHIEAPAGQRNQKIGSPWGRPQFSALPGSLRPGYKGLPALCHQAAIGAA
jgi:hypothetical protein